MATRVPRDVTVVKKAPVKKAAPRRIGRMPKVTPEIIKAVTQAIRVGNSQEVAAEVAGIGESTFYRWMAQGEQDDADPLYKEFWQEIRKAKAEAEAHHIANINRAAAGGTWQASAWWLERTRPKKYGRFDRSEISGPEGGPVQVLVSTEDLERKVAAILAKRGES